jgi:hypothetical protein
MGFFSEVMRGYRDSRAAREGHDRAARFEDDPTDFFDLLQKPLCQ